MYFKGIDVSLAAFMRANGLTQADVAKAMGMSESALSKRRRGIVTFDLREASKLASFMGRSLDELLEEPHCSEKTVDSARELASH